MTKILTEIPIPQSSRWQSETVLTDDLYGFIARKGLLPLWGGKKMKRFLNFTVILRKMREFDLIISPARKGAQALALLRWLFRIRQPRQIILEMMLSELDSSLKGRMKSFLKKLAYSNIDVMFVSSPSEKETYSAMFGIPRDRFQFLPFHTNIAEPKIITAHQGYIFSAGRTDRDFATLIQAVRGTDIPLVIVSDEKNARGLTACENVSIRIDVPYEEYFELLKNCWFVVLPLRKLIKSTGQVAMLEAMGLGKPVVATDTTGTHDYIAHGYNGLMVPPNDPVELRHAIESLRRDDRLFRQLACNGMETVKKKHTLENYVDAVLQKAHEMSKAASQSKLRPTDRGCMRRADAKSETIE